MGSVSWQFKKFADASSKPWFAQAWKDKVAAGFTNSAGMNGDKQSTLTTLFTLAMQHGMLWVSQGLMPANTKAAKRNDVNYLVSYSGAMAQSPSDALPADMPRATWKRPGCSASAWPRLRRACAADTSKRDASAERAGTYHLAARMQISGDLSDAQLQELQAVAHKCPVHKLMTAVTTEIATTVERMA
jgi:multimeric flavodoxin WrbA